MRQPLTEARAISTITRLTQIYLSAGLAEFAVLDLDTDFKNPSVHSRIKRIKDDVVEIRKHLCRSPLFGDMDTDYSDDVTGELNEMLGYVVNFSLEDLREWNKILAQLVKEAKERALQSKI